MRNSNKLVRGIGLKGMKYPTKLGGKRLKEYRAWSDMLERCTERFWNRQPAYTGTTCSENFKSFEYFYEWCQEQVGFGSVDDKGRGWQLDKDITCKEYKIYSEDTCVFVPSRINTLLIKREASRGEWPIGVCWHKRDKMFQSKCNNGTGKSIFLGSFKTAQEAFQAYKTFKEALIKEVANEYKEQLDYRVYEALMNYEVNEND